MPHFSFQFLQSDGPQVAPFVGVSQPRQQALRQAGLNVPQPAFIRGLVDTGASSTAVDPSVVKTLGLQPTGSLRVVTPSTGTTPAQRGMYDVSLTIPLGASGLSFTIGAMQVFESSLTVQGFHALIGRDVLANCPFVYDGRNQVFGIAF